MNRLSITLLSATVLPAGAAAWWFWPQPPEPAPAPLMPQAVVTVPAVEPMPAASAAPLPEPVADPAVVLPPLAAADPTVKSSLLELLGQKAVLGLLQTDGFVRRFVVTVDNLPRGHAAARLWPVNPTPGRFSVGAGGRVEARNADRYTPFVGFVEGVDPAAAAALYRRLYPLLQGAYAELGYPGQRFHGRLLDVVDHLLATPRVAGPLAVTLTKIRGPFESRRPWVRYEFSDPKLQDLSAGQKMLLRSGDANQQRLQSWLRRLRAELVR